MTTRAFASQTSPSHHPALDRVQPYAPHQALENPAIFLLEDSSVSAGVLEAYLAASGFSAPTWAKSIQEAQHYVPDIAAGAFGLLFFDIQLPDGSGLDFIQSVRAKVSAPICAYTALTSATAIKQLEQAGFDHIFFKPMKKSDFATRLEQVLSKAAPL